MRPLIVAAVTVVLAGLSAWAEWPRKPPGEFQPFSAPDVVQIVATDEENTTRDLIVGEGRIVAQRDLDLIFRGSEGPRQVSITGLSGHARLFLGDDGPMLDLSDDVWALLADAKATRVQRPEGDAAAQVALRCADGRLQVLAGGVPLLDQPWTGAPPKGRTGAKIVARSSFESMAQQAEDGEHVLLPKLPDEGWWRVAWALAAVLLGVPAIALLFAGAPGLGGALLAIAVVAALAAGLVSSVRSNNRDRVEAPNVRCATDPLEAPEPASVDLYHPLEIERRNDGNFTLEAQVTLAKDTVLDVLVRGTSLEMDRGVVLTLSTDARMPSGTALNLSTEWQGQDGPRELATLAADKPLALRVVAQDDELEASVDGVRLGQITSQDLRAGRTAFHVLAGSATVAGVRITPGSAPRELSGLLLRWMLTAALGAAALAGLLALLLRPRARAGLALAPLAAASWPAAPSWLPPLAVVASVVLLVARAPRGRRWLALLAGAALAGLCSWALLLAPDEYSPHVLNRMDVADVRGGPLPAEFLWARHPVVRRFEFFARDHSFRSGLVTEPRTPGILRIVSLGSSSTYGYGVTANQAWSAFLQRRLGDGVEVINAGVPGSDAECLRWIALGLIKPLAPDIVIVDLSFNDHARLAQFPQREHFERFLSTGVSWLDQQRAEFGAWWVRRGWEDYRDARTKGESIKPEDLERYEAAPAREFQASLRDIAELCRSFGARVVFVAEPARDGDKDPILKSYHEVMLALGQELGAPVVQPQDALDALGKGAFIDVVHPSEKGHQVVGAAILDVLVHQMGVKPPH
jgi:lysophospholipase L1-like esterase